MSFMIVSHHIWFRSALLAFQFPFLSPKKTINWLCIFYTKTFIWKTIVKRKHSKSFLPNCIMNWSVCVCLGVWSLDSGFLALGKWIRWLLWKWMMLMSHFGECIMWKWNGPSALAPGSALTAQRKAWAAFSGPAGWCPVVHLCQLIGSPALCPS